MLVHNTTGIGFCSQTRNKETLKMEKLRKLVINQDVDILGLTETNKRWSVIPEENTIWSAVNKWKEHTRTYATYNKTDPGKSEQLYGGTAISVFNENIFHIQNKGEDKRSLGRWNWIELQGKTTSTPLSYVLTVRALAMVHTQSGRNTY